MRLIDYISQGGPIMYILLFLNIIGLALMVYKFFGLSKEKKDIEKTSIYLAERVSSRSDAQEARVVIELTKQEVSEHVGSMESGLNTIKIIATVSPLLGLLGTVLGVLLSFRVISQGGMSDPSSFAGGISMALVTTVGGLIVAIPHYIGHNYLIGLLDLIEGGLEKGTFAKVTVATKGRS